jgi:hypothetical protein
MTGALAVGVTAFALFACGSKDGGDTSASTSTKDYGGHSTSSSQATRSGSTSTPYTVPMNFVDGAVIVTYPDAAADAGDGSDRTDGASSDAEAAPDGSAHDAAPQTGDASTDAAAMREASADANADVSVTPSDAAAD